MALWQYKFNIIPEKTEQFLISWDDSEGSDTVLCWQNSKTDVNTFYEIEIFLPKIESWSDNILQFGTLESHCVEIFKEKRVVLGVSFRIDYTDKYYINLLSKMIDFCLRKRFLILDESYNLF